MVQEKGANFLLSFDAAGHCLEDSWHQTLKKAVRQAQFLAPRAGFGARRDSTRGLGPLGPSTRGVLSCLASCLAAGWDASLASSTPAWGSAGGW